MSAYTEIPKIIAETGELPPKVLGNLDNRYPVASSQSQDYWVATYGNDNNNGSQDFPFATLARAVQALPDIIHRGHTYTIHIGIGEWNERLTPRDITVHGELYFRGTTPDEQSHRISHMLAHNVTGHMAFHRIKFIRENGAAMAFNRCAPHMLVEDCDIIDTGDNTSGEGNHGVLADNGSQVMVRRTNIEGKRYAIRANYLSRIFSADNTGKDNVFGIGARWGGLANVYGTSPGADTEFTNDSGGLVVLSQGAKIGVDRLEPEKGLGEIALVDRKEASEGRWVYKKWLVRNNNAQLNDEIPVDGRLRLHFEAQTTISVNFAAEIKFSYYPISTGVPRYVHNAYHGAITSTEYQRENMTTMHSTVGPVTSENMIQITHTGSSGQFYIDIAPNPGEGARNGWYGVDIEWSQMREYDAPKLVSTEIIG